MTNQTPNQTKAYSEIRDEVEVKEIPIIKLRFGMLSTDRVIDSKKLGISADAFQNMPEHIQTKLKQKVVPNSAIRPLDTIRKSVTKYMNSAGSKHDLFGFVLGHTRALEVEEKLCEYQAEFNDAIMEKDVYEDKCAKILDSFINDPDLKSYSWYDRFIEALVNSQPDWDEYFEACKFEIHPFYIGESGSTSAHKFKTAKDSFKEICAGTKGNLIHEISETSLHIYNLALKNGPTKGIKEVTWRQIYKICDKLQSLSFVSPSISIVEAEIRSILDQALPASGDIYGIQRTNLMSILSCLTDPFKLADKVDNGRPLFSKVDLSLGLNNNELDFDETETTDESKVEEQAKPAQETESLVESEDEVEVVQTTKDESNDTDSNDEKLVASSTNESSGNDLNDLVEASVLADDVISDLASEATNVNLQSETDSFVFHDTPEW